MSEEPLDQTDQTHEEAGVIGRHLAGKGSTQTPRPRFQAQVTSVVILRSRRESVACNVCDVKIPYTYILL